jgi:hypothetical protein
MSDRVQVRWTLPQVHVASGDYFVYKADMESVGTGNHRPSRR